jgi:hypothetical protein
MRGRCLQAAWLVVGCGGAITSERSGLELAPRAVVEVMPAPPREAPAPGRLADNAGCERCHVEIAAEWRASQHRSSFSDPEFARAFQREPIAFCQSCHAPEADPSQPVPSDAAEVGVGCVTCHVPHGSDGRVLARGAGVVDEHPLRASESFVHVAGCASCHEFDFRAQPGLAMQSTVTEHAESPFADDGCGSCHMPLVGEGATRHRSHVFGASRDPEMLRRAVVVEVERLDADRVRIRLAPGEVGHAFPTGDLFRRLLVRAEAVDAEGDVLAEDERPLARHFANAHAHQGARSRALVRDDRVGAPALRDAGGVVEIELDVGPDAQALEVRWQVVHQRVDMAMPNGDAAIAGETIVVSGALAPTGDPP